MESVQSRFDAQQRRLERLGQGHLLRYWPELDAGQRLELLSDLETTDIERAAALVDAYVRRKPTIEMPARLEPAPVFPATPGAGQSELYVEARRAGEQAIRDGKVAAFTVAGGQGTRLGYDGPKGGFKISPVRNAPLFQLFAEYLLGVERAYGKRPRWYVMTSPSNHDETLRIFREQRWFGLGESDVVFFSQGQMPAFMLDGRIALGEKHRLALSPDGHGGSLTALLRSGALADMRQRGVEYVSYFQVDNPLVRAIDPLFVGLHIRTGSEMSSKAVTKAHDLERVGNFCLADGKVTIIEYSDLPESLALAKNADGSRRFDAGSIAVHVLSRAFIERLTDAKSAVQLPWHRADKKVELIGDDGALVKPEKPNAVKLEMFVFDAVPLAKNPLVLLTPREEEFSPVKNAEGADSPATTRRDLVRRAARWLEACGARVPRGGDGEPSATLEISPRFALDAADLKSRLRTIPEIAAGASLCLE